MTGTRTIKLVSLCAAFALIAVGCAPSNEEGAVAPADDASAKAATVTIAPGPNVQTELQEALIEAEPGAVIQLEEGTYNLTLGLSLDVDNVTLRGRGMDKTILDFKNQEAGAEGLFISSDDVVIQDFAIIDTKGNAMKSHGTNNIVIRRIRTEWTGGPKSTNGAYGLYPVVGQNTLIEECVAIGASDAGIYTGQTEHAIIRNCRVEYNVAGIEIENCHFAEAYGNVATNNTGGILVFDLPDLPVQRGGDVRLYDNKVFENNHENFAPAGNIVAGVSPGTGIMIMANSRVEIFDNDIRDNNTYGILVTSYLSTGIAIKDKNYYPYAESIHIHDNTFGPSGTAPEGRTGSMVAMVTGVPVPAVVWDGVANPERMVDGKLEQEARVVLHDNKMEGGEMTFVDLNGAAILPDPTKAKINRNIKDYTGELPPVAPVVLGAAD